MKLSSLNFRFFQLLVVAILTTSVFLFITSNSHTVHALPEFANRTGESCATCHVNPGGGGPRTLRGLLWAAQGRPDAVPELPGVLLAPGVSDGAELYEIACSSCHGIEGEGLFGRELARTGLRASKIRSNILKGRLNSGMPAFDGMFTDEQLQALVDYVVALANGEVESYPGSLPLPPPEFDCATQLSGNACGGN